MSVVAGEERVIATAVAEVPRDRFVGALAFLQPAALTARTRELVGPGRRALRERLQRLREHGAAAAGTEPPEIVHLQRIAPASLAMAIGTLVAAGALLFQVGDPTLVWDVFTKADWGWIAVAIVLSFTSNIGFAIVLQGTVPVRLPLWRTTELQVAMSFTNLAIPGVGGLAMQIRYLQKQGIDLSSAVAAGGLLSTAGNLVAAFGLFGLAVAIDPAKVDFGLIPTSGLAVLATVALAAAFLFAALVGGIPRLRRAVVPPVHRAAATLWAAMRSPRLVTELVAGNVVALLLAVYTMEACLLAFDGHGAVLGRARRVHRDQHDRRDRPDPRREHRSVVDRPLRVRSSRWVSPRRSRSRPSSSTRSSTTTCPRSPGGSRPATSPGTTSSDPPPPARTRPGTLRPWRCASWGRRG